MTLPDHRFQLYMSSTLYILTHRLLMTTQVPFQMQSCQLRLTSTPSATDPPTSQWNRKLPQVNLAASEGGITSEANVTDIHEALNFDQNDSVSAACIVLDAFWCICFV